jgi:phospholipid-translocating ATPase
MTHVRAGFLFTYIAPLAFVLSITMLKEAVDDLARYRRDAEANSAVYTRLTPAGPERVAARDIQVGHVLLLHSNQRVPADLVLLRAHDPSGAIFIRTDQLDGETDWKLRLPVPTTQALPDDASLFDCLLDVAAAEPSREIYQFVGNVTSYRSPAERHAHQQHLQHLQHQHQHQHSATRASTTAASVYEPPSPLASSSPASSSSSALSSSSSSSSSASAAAAGGAHVEPLSLENVLWANTVVATGSVLGLVVYTGAECRAAMNAHQAAEKTGQLDLEVNLLTKLLFVFTLLLAGAIVGVKGLHGAWYIDFFRFVLIFSSIIPISLRVNLDMSKILSSYLLMRDPAIPDTVVRNTAIPEELGRVDYLFSDKTGTLTQNQMHFQRLALSASLAFDVDTIGLVRAPPYPLHALPMPSPCPTIPRVACCLLLVTCCSDMHWITTCSLVGHSCFLCFLFTRCATSSWLPATRSRPRPLPRPRQTKD